MTAPLSPDEARARLRTLVPPGADVIVPIGQGEPQTLLDLLESIADELDGVRVHRMDPFVERPYIRGEFGDRLRHVDYYLGPGSREAYRKGTCDLVPNHFSEMPLLLRQATKRTVVLAAAAGPDDEGRFSLGTNADYVASMIGEVPFLLEATSAMPFTRGENLLRADQVAGWIATDRALPPVRHRDPSPADHAIAELVADMVPDGACLQIGVGGTPGAVTAALTGHRDLGIHTECLASGLAHLVDLGVVTGVRKKQRPGEHVTTFSIGDEAMHRWLDGRTDVMFLPVEWTNDPRVVAEEPNFVSINATTEVDLMGQAASETIAGRYWSSSGGQSDFARGAMYSEGGRAFLVTHAATSSGMSRIRAQLTAGSVVTTLKNTVDHVVTEYGVASLRGRSIAQRARELIAIAAPEHRDELRYEAKRFELLP
ncbi:acetyl-CoA hydrolase/transferase family protein [Actinomycetospora soli]|uniref:acetyl-CoA hydrolase/transferase family protein n=1 Tax=Actinomycetospora soli TaxID=2893887 RepID=UPI001E2A54E1|nr:acetyl-CoA hydrolase/transferase C-terminal domain-containing protein [Actinomycetospora soli]MCD2185806.1 propionyl-CoA--succinate CoA transferase [Actinomycetospora soli]